MDTKPLLQSKIFWLSVIGLVLVVVGAAINRPYDPMTGEVEESIVETIFAQPFDLMAVLLNVAVIVARWFFTKTRIEGSG